MDILSSIIIGAIAGVLAPLVYKPCKASEWSTLAVGILGALLGMATSKWMGASALLSGAIGSAATIFIWAMAQRLFLATALPAKRD